MLYITLQSNNLEVLITVNLVGHICTYHQSYLKGDYADIHQAIQMHTNESVSPFTEDDMRTQFIPVCVCLSVISSPHFHVG